MNASHSFSFLQAGVGPKEVFPSAHTRHHRHSTHSTHTQLYPLCASRYSPQPESGLSHLVPLCFIPPVTADDRIPVTSPRIAECLIEARSTFRLAKSKGPLPLPDDRIRIVHRALGLIPCTRPAHQPRFFENLAAADTRLNRNCKNSIRHSHLLSDLWIKSRPAIPSLIDRTFQQQSQFSQSRRLHIFQFSV